MVPAYNEAERIGPSLVAILDYARASKEPIEIVVVDDGSTDRTVAVSREALTDPPHRVVSNGVNRGKGFSIRHGVAEARGRYILVSDADLSTPIEEVTRLLARIDTQERGIVIGSRALKDSNVEIHQNPLRELMGKVFNRIVRILTGLPFHDTQCGFKLMRREDVAPIFERSRIDGFSYDVELLYVAVKKGLPVAEMAVRWRNAPGSKVGILTDPLRMLRDVIRIRRWYRQGVYDA